MEVMEYVASFKIRKDKMLKFVETMLDCGFSIQIEKAKKNTIEIAIFKKGIE